MSTELILIRHGEIETSLFSKVLGYQDPPLNSVGNHSAELTADLLSVEQNIFALYSSPQQRAMKTAEIIGAKLNLIPKPLYSLREWDYHRNIRIVDRIRFLGSTFLSLRFPILSPLLWDQWAKSRTLQDFLQDVSIVISKIIVLNPEKRIVIVSHWGTIDAILTKHFPIHGKWNRGLIRNCSITTIIVDNGMPQLLKFNEINHLYGN